MDNHPDHRAMLASRIDDLLERYASNLAEDERVLPTAQALEIIASVLWLNGSRSGSTASIYAMDHLADALGGPMLASLAAMKR